MIEISPVIRYSGYTFIKPSNTHWVDFIATNPDANIFHHPSWMEVMQECYGYTVSIFALLDPQGNVRAGIPLMEVSSHLTGRRWVSLPFSDHCAPLYCDEQALEELTDSLVGFFHSNHRVKMEIRWELPPRPEIQQLSEFVMHTIRLDPDPAQVSRNIKRTYLQNIHTAGEMGVRIEVGDRLEHLKAFYQMHLETRRRHGVPIQPWKYFLTLKRLLFDKDLGFLLLAYRADQCIAGSIFLHSNNTLTYKYSASVEEGLKYHPNKLILWEAIRWGCDHGYTRLDLGRTNLENEGLQNFKSRWGSIEELLHYSVLSSKTVRPSGKRLDHLLQSVISHSPLWVCRLTGELLYKHVG